MISAEVAHKRFACSNACSVVLRVNHFIIFITSTIIFFDNDNDEQSSLKSHILLKKIIRSPRPRAADCHDELSDR